MAAPAQEETRAMIKFCVDLGKTPTETMKMMKDANRSSNVSRSLVFKWHKRFSEGRESLKDDTGRGRKRIVNAGAVTAVKSLIEEDRRLTVSDISTKVGVSYGSVHSILRNQLKMSKVHARWVPRLLKNAEKQRREEKFIHTPTEGQGQPVRREVHVDHVYGQMGYAAVPFRA